MDPYNEGKIIDAKKIVQEANEKNTKNAICQILHDMRHGDVQQLREKFGAREGDDRFLANQILLWSQQ